MCVCMHPGVSMPLYLQMSDYGLCGWSLEVCVCMHAHMLANRFCQGVSVPMCLRVSDCSLSLPLCAGCDCLARPHEYVSLSVCICPICW